MENKQTSPALPEKTPWVAEPAENGFYRVVNADSVVLAQQCVREEAELFAAAPDLRDACVAALSQMTADRKEYVEGDIKQLREALAKAGTPLKRYRVVVHDTRLREVHLDAFDEDEAQLKAEELDGDEFESTDQGEWYVTRIDEVTPNAHGKPA